MNQINFNSIEQFDKLEEMRTNRIDPKRVSDPELAADLRLIYWMERHAAGVQNGPEPSLLKPVMKRIRKRSKFWLTGLAAAAAILVAVAMNWRDKSPSDPLFIDPDMLDNAMEADDREAMLTYLRKTEKLFTSLREPAFSCSPDLLDMMPEKELAKDLLFQQKLFSPEMDKLKYLQVRGFFHHLELILVDLNSLDPCTNPLEIEAINSHIKENRILTKLRLIAQEIQVS